MSSSLDQMSLTGRPTAFEARTAWTTKSTSWRRPKPPPSRVVCSWTRSGGTPSASAAAARARDGFWVGAQISQPLPLARAVQFIGSMVACARKGTS